MESEEVYTVDEKLAQIANDILEECMGYINTSTKDYKDKIAGASREWLAGMIVIAGEKAQKYLDILKLIEEPT